MQRKGDEEMKTKKQRIEELEEKNLKLEDDINFLKKVIESRDRRINHLEEKELIYVEDAKRKSKEIDKWIGINSYGKLINVKLKEELEKAEILASKAEQWRKEGLENYAKYEQVKMELDQTKKIDFLSKNNEK